jgi:Flp pilus assembly protein TadG
MRSKSQRGNALLEFALGFSLLWALFGGIFQFGYTFYIYNRLMTAVNDAALQGSKLQYDTGNTTKFTNAVTNMVLYGSTSSASSVSIPGLTSSNVNVSANLQNSIPTYVTVSITNFTVNGVFASFTFNGKPSVTMPYMGSVSCSTC